MLEILQGMDSDARAATMEDWLRQFPIRPMLSPDAAVRAARNYRTLRQQGVTIRKNGRPDHRHLLPRPWLAAAA